MDIHFEPERTLLLSIYLSIEMAYGDENDFGWCNLFIKFALFVMNFLVWVNHYMFSTGREKVVFSVVRKTVYSQKVRLRVFLLSGKVFRVFAMIEALKYW